MTKDQKNEVIEVLKQKFTQYNNFYITDTESLSVAQVSALRRTCLVGGRHVDGCFKLKLKICVNINDYWLLII